MNKIVTVAVLGFASTIPSFGGIVPPALDLSINGISIGASDATTYTDPSTGISTMSGDIDAAGLLLTYSITADSDPFLTYGFSVVNLTGAPLVVADQFSTPVTSGPWNEADASLSISAVPGFTPFGLLASGPNSVATATAVDSGGNVDNLNVGLGGNCPALTHAGSCYAVTTSSTFADQDFTSLNVAVDFTLDGIGSSATVSGRVDLLESQSNSSGLSSSTPEPGTMALTGLGLLALCWGLRNRNLLRRLA